jgi:cyclin-dependent kinase-like
VCNEQQRIYLVFEWLNRTVLDEITRYRRLDSLQAKKIIYQLLKACSHMHQRGVFHRDIKPENLMLSRNGVVKICDLGSARLLNNPQPMSEYVSTRWYRAPELLVNHQNYGAEIDVWAIGCIFVELLTGKALFNGKNELDMLRLILKMFHGSEALP